jgi:hypothetical protein
MADPKAFSGEQIQVFQDWIDGKLDHYPLGYDADRDARIIIKGFLATIAEYKQVLGSAMRQVSDLNKGNIADRKRIEGLENQNKTLRVHFLSQMTELRAFIEPAKRTLEKAMHVVCNNDPEQENVVVAKILSLNTKITDQTAEIERLRGLLEPLMENVKTKQFQDTLHQYRNYDVDYEICKIYNPTGIESEAKEVDVSWLVTVMELLEELRQALAKEESNANESVG